MLSTQPQISAFGGQRRWRAWCRASGMTLIELMITIAIGSILMAVAVPSFQTTIQTNRTATQVNEVLRTLNLARSEAVKRGQTISICPSTNSTSCTGAMDWAVGWILFVGDDPTATPLTVLDSGPAPAGVAAFTGDSARVTFNGSGESTLGSISLAYKPDACTGDDQRSITINAVGRAASSEATCSP